eukprot:2123157-Rhodomonas_salina.1
MGPGLSAASVRVQVLGLGSKVEATCVVSQQPCRLASIFSDSASLSRPFGEARLTARHPQFGFVC